MEYTAPGGHITFRYGQAQRIGDGIADGVTVVGRCIRDSSIDDDAISALESAEFEARKVQRAAAFGGGVGAEAKQSHVVVPFEQSPLSCGGHFVAGEGWGGG